MRERAVARQIASGESVEPELPVASSSKPATTWEGTKVAFSETDTPLSFSDAPEAPAETKEARRAAKKARKAEKEAKRAVKAELADTEVKAGKKKRKRDGE